MSSPKSSCEIELMVCVNIAIHQRKSVLRALLWIIFSPDALYTGGSGFVAQSGLASTQK
jgi:hypothetical protein